MSYDKATPLDALYDSYDVLSSAKDIKEHAVEYLDAISATKKSEKEKRLASQMISKFFKYFPALQNEAIDAVFDLCEDDETSIRIAAMKTLPTYCIENNKYLIRVADILAQLLQLEDPVEFNVASTALMEILKEDPVTVFKSIFKVINGKTTEPLVRERCIKFVVTKIKLLDQALTQEVEDLLISEIKLTLQDATANEFVLLMSYLTTSKYSNSFTAQQEFIEIAAEIAEIDQEFDPLDTESNNTDRLITCVKYVLPYFSSKVDSMKFVMYYCDTVLPLWDKIGTLELGVQYQLVLAQQLAIMSQFCGTLENPLTYVELLLEKLKIYMPPPPEDTNTTTIPYLDFTIVESMLFAFHQLARQTPELLTNEEIFKDFRPRLMYFARAASGCLNVLKTSNKDKVFTPEEKKIRELSPTILNNINTIIKDLFHKPPSFKCNIILSFKIELKKSAIVTRKSATETKTVTIGQKRHIPITYENGANQGNKVRDRSSTNEKKIYTPPSGKYSNNFSTDRKSHTGGGGGGGGHRFRGGRGNGRGTRSRGRGGYRN